MPAKQPRQPVTLLEGFGFDYNGQNFGRLTADTPAELASDEYAKPGSVIAYLTAACGRYPAGTRVHILQRAIKETFQ